VTALSALTLLVGRHEEHPACDVRCKWFAYGPADATATPSSLSCFIKIQTDLTFLVPAYSGCPGKEAVEQLCVW